MKKFLNSFSPTLPMGTLKAFPRTMEEAFPHDRAEYAQPFENGSGKPRAIPPNTKFHGAMKPNAKGHIMHRPEEDDSKSWKELSTTDWGWIVGTIVCWIGLAGIILAFAFGWIK